MAFIFLPGRQAARSQGKTDKGVPSKIFGIPLFKEAIFYKILKNYWFERERRATVEREKHRSLLLFVVPLVYALIG